MNHIDEYIYRIAFAVATIAAVIYLFKGTMVIPLMGFNIAASIFIFEKGYVMVKELFFINNMPLSGYDTGTLLRMASHFGDGPFIGYALFLVACGAIIAVSWQLSQFLVACVGLGFIILHAEHRRQMYSVLRQTWEKVRESDQDSAGDS